VEKIVGGFIILIGVVMVIAGEKGTGGAGLIPSIFGGGTTLASATSSTSSASTAIDSALASLATPGSPGSAAAAAANGTVTASPASSGIPAGATFPAGSTGVME
jgi:hypothetical protein